MGQILAGSWWNLSHISGYHSYHGNLGEWIVINESSHDGVPNTSDCATPLLKLDEM
jgi:hypothetical protein